MIVRLYVCVRVRANVVSFLALSPLILKGLFFVPLFVSILSLVNLVLPQGTCSIFLRTTQICPSGVLNDHQRAHGGRLFNLIQKKTPPIRTYFIALILFLTVSLSPVSKSVSHLTLYGPAVNKRTDALSRGHYMNKGR